MGLNELDPRQAELLARRPTAAGREFDHWHAEWCTACDDRLDADLADAEKNGAPITVYQPATVAGRTIDPGVYRMPMRPVAARRPIRTVSRGRVARKVVASRSARSQSRRVGAARSPDDPPGDDPPAPLVAAAGRREHSDDTPLQRVHQLALDLFTTAEEWSACGSVFTRRGLILGAREEMAA